MEFNKENIESVIESVGLRLDKLNQTMETIQKYNEQIKPMVEKAIKENPEASHDEIVEMVAKEFDERQEELQTQENNNERD